MCSETEKIGVGVRISAMDCIKTLSKRINLLKEIQLFISKISVDVNSNIQHISVYYLNSEDIIVYLITNKDFDISNLCKKHNYVMFKNTNNKDNIESYQICNQFGEEIFTVTYSKNIINNNITHGFSKQVSFTDDNSIY